MEGKKYTDILNKKPVIIGFLVLLFHAVGLAGFLNPAWRELFITLVPFHLLLMFALMLISQQNYNPQFFLFLLIIYLAGFGIEYLGVHTGLIFGSYNYGETLGLKLAEIPLLIGLNWVLLIYTVGMTIRYLNFKNSFIQAALGAGILVLLDVLIEPVAIRFDYWTWQDGAIPLQNYIAWFIVSFAGCLAFNRMKFEKQNPAAIVLLLAQFLFFISLNLAA